MKEFSAREARYGLRGVRIGEASHPGPPKFSRCGSRSRDISLAGVSLPDSDAESDHEPLISRRPGLRRSRDVAPQSSEDDGSEDNKQVRRVESIRGGFCPGNESGSRCSQ